MAPGPSFLSPFIPSHPQMHSRSTLYVQTVSCSGRSRWLTSSSYRGSGLRNSGHGDSSHRNSGYNNSRWQDDSRSDISAILVGEVTGCLHSPQSSRDEASAGKRRSLVTIAHNPRYHNGSSPPIREIEWDERPQHQVSPSPSHTLRSQVLSRSIPYGQVLFCPATHDS